eukprot:5894846-Amphidinium_carterae.1
MARLIDSESRVAELLLPPEVLPALQLRGWRTFAGLAFSTAFAPNQTTEDAHFQTEVMNVILGPDSPHA